MRGLHDIPFANRPQEASRSSPSSPSEPHTIGRTSVAPGSVSVRSVPVLGGVDVSGRVRPRKADARGSRSRRAGPRDRDAFCRRPHSYGKSAREPSSVCSVYSVVPKSSKQAKTPTLPAAQLQKLKVDFWRMIPIRLRIEAIENSPNTSPMKRGLVRW